MDNFFSNLDLDDPATYVCMYPKKFDSWPGLRGWGSFGVLYQARRPLVAEGFFVGPLVLTE